MMFGAHVSAAGGLATAFDRAEEAGCDAFQIFTKNKGAWAARPLDEDAIRAFRDRAASSKCIVASAHASYLLNLASPSRELRARSEEALRIELERCEALGIPYLVLHPGAHTGSGVAAGLRRVATGLDRVHRRTAGFHARVLLENSAGQGTSVCHRLEELAEIISRVREPERLGVCLDTCHLFAAGYDFRTADGYEKTLDEVESSITLERVLCWHVNDSKRELGSRIDRHEHIGLGQLGADGFRRLVKDQRFATVPMIFELPPEGDRIRTNLATLRRLAAPSKTRKRSR